MTSRLQELVQYKVLTSQTVRDLIAARIYPHRLESVKDPTLPCACVDGLGGSYVSRLPKVGMIPFSLWCWSRTSIEEAFDIHDAVFSVLHAQQFYFGTVSCVCEEFGPPIDDYEEDLDGYYAMTSWRSVVLE